MTIWASAVSEPTAVARARSVPFLLIVAPISLSPGFLLDRQALAGDHRLVDLALALDDLGVDRYLRARPDEQQVADLHLGRRHLDGLAVTDDDRRRRREVEQRADRVVRAAARAHLEPVAEQDEGGEHRGRLVEHVAVVQKVAATTE